MIKRIVRGCLLSCLLSVLGGCQSPPTAVVERDGNLSTRAFSQVEFGKKEFNANESVILDTRSRFDYQLSKTPRSSHFYWQDWNLFDFTGAESDKRRVQLQRRLALKGIGPDTPVVIFGYGLKGSGEEFYVAAVLGALGVQKVLVTNPVTWKSALVTRDIEPLGNVPYWNKPLQWSWNCPVGKIHDLPVKDKGQYLKKDFSIHSAPWLKKMKKGRKYKISKSKDLFVFGLLVSLIKNGHTVCL